ncbi:MAG: GWxTD domain-containing protein [Owenweeksia sp.]
MTIKHTSFLILGILILFGATSCGSKKGYQATNINYIYDTKNLALRPDFHTYHVNDSVTRIYYRVNSNNLLYMRNGENAAYRAVFSVKYSVVPSFEDVTILDSGGFAVQDVEMDPPQKALTGSFEIKTRNIPDNGQFVLHLVMADLNRKVSFENFIRISKQNEQSRENFLLTDTAGNVIFKDHVGTGAPFFLSYNKLNAGRYYVSYYNRDFPLALPPYSSTTQESFTLDPDTTYMVDADKPIILEKSGFYHFRLDTTQWQGFTVFSFYDQFPYVAKRLHLGPPMRYLTTKREYDKISEVINDPVALKAAVDEFWLERSGSVERSKVLVEAFYSRVQEANIFFSSYLEGWKSDRGIIYVIYGPPDKVYRSTAGEAWVYGDETSSLSYYFNFIKVSNPFSGNDFSLNRMTSYRYGWGQAIESWRNGRIYNSKDIQREQDESDQYRYQQRTPYWY